MKTHFNISKIVAGLILSAAVTYHASAISLTIGDAHELGFVNYGIPAGDADIPVYINAMIGLGLGGSTIVTINNTDNTVTRSGNSFSPLDTAVLASRATYGNVNNPTVDINVGSTGYEYLLVKYDGPNYGSEVWYIGGLTGTITIPAFAGQYGISGSSLLTRYPGPGTSVPDGGTTFGCLTLALGAMGVAVRKVKAK